MKLEFWPELEEMLESLSQHGHEPDPNHEIYKIVAEEREELKSKFKNKEHLYPSEIIQALRLRYQTLDILEWASAWPIWEHIKKAVLDAVVRTIASDVETAMSGLAIDDTARYLILDAVARALMIGFTLAKLKEEHILDL